MGSCFTFYLCLAARHAADVAVASRLKFPAVRSVAGGVPRVGPASAKLLARHFGSLEKLAAAQPADFPVELGNATRTSVQAYFASTENRTVVITLSQVILPAATSSQEHQLPNHPLEDQ